MKALSRALHRSTDERLIDRVSRKGSTSGKGLGGYSRLDCDQVAGYAGRSVVALRRKRWQLGDERARSTLLEAHGPQENVSSYNDIAITNYST